MYASESLIDDIGGYIEFVKAERITYHKFSDIVENMSINEVDFDGETALINSKSLDVEKDNLLMKIDYLSDELMSEWHYFLSDGKDTIATFYITGTKAILDDNETLILQLLMTARWENPFDKEEPFYTIDFPYGWTTAFQYKNLDIYTYLGQFPIEEDGAGISVINEFIVLTEEEYETYVREKAIIRPGYKDLVINELSQIKIVDNNVKLYDIYMAEVKGVDEDTREDSTLYICYLFTDYTVISFESTQLTKDEFINIMKTFRFNSDM